MDVEDLTGEFEQPDGEPVKVIGLDPFADDEPLACGLEDPEECESCQ